MAENSEISEKNEEILSDNIAKSINVQSEFISIGQNDVVKIDIPEGMINISHILLNGNMDIVMNMELLAGKSSLRKFLHNGL